MTLDPIATSGDEPEASQKLTADKFTVVLRQIISHDATASVAARAVRQVLPPPVLCPRPDSPVRYMPLAGIGASPIVEGLLPIWKGDKNWTFVDFASFEGADFAYAVYRSLLNRGPSKKQIRIAESESVEDRFLLLLAADHKSRSVGGPGRLVNLAGSRMLYSTLRTARKLKFAPLVALLRMLLAARAESLFLRNRDALVQRRLILGVLNLLSRRG